MNYLDKYNEWLNSDIIDENTKNELKLIADDKKEIEERFYKDLEFGTGGLRGIMGAGTNRLNKYTVGKATLGLANYLCEKYTNDDLKTRGVAIAFDTRNNSQFFAEVAGKVLSSKGIKVYLFEVPVPTPELSFAVKHYNCVSGIVLTASHNPKEYNGYKVYDEYGCQLVPKDAEELISYVNSVKDFSEIDFSSNANLVKNVNCTEEFTDEVLMQSLNNDNQSKIELKVVYTPIHGTGNIPVRLALKKSGFEKVYVVSEQELPDGNFSTVLSPNPEEKNALNMGIEYANKNDGDIVLGTDPDCDRVGVAVKHLGEYKLLTGNQIGALLTDYVCSKKDFSKINNPAIIKTIVTSELGAEIAKTYGLTVFSTLTGFKFIGEKITQFENIKKSNLNKKNYTFVMGYEESYGYLIGTHARDKDAVVSSLLICEMTAEYKKQGKTLFDKLQDLYSKYGIYKDSLDSFTLKGKDGLEKINEMMKTIRNDSNVFDNLKQVIDYLNVVEDENGFGPLPKSNVLKFIFEDDSWIAIRPSGTEPKIKVYYSIKSKSENLANARLDNYKTLIKEKLGIKE